MPGEGIAILSSAKQTITKIGLDSCAAKLLSPGTVLFSSRATIGKLGIIIVPMATNQGFVNLSPKPGITSRFLAYSLWNRIERIKGLAGSTTFKEVSRGNIKKFRLAVPPLPEQEHIVGILDAAEELRRSREQADHRTADLIPALFHEMFGDPATNPKGWPVFPIAELCAGKYGVKAGPFGSALKKDCYTTSGYRVYGQEQVIAGNFSIGDYFIDQEKFESLKSCEVKPGDLLISLVGTIGRVVVVPSDVVPGIINPRLLKVTPNPEILDSVFLARFLSHASTQESLSQSANGGTMGVLNAGILKKVWVPLPPLPLQRDFAERVAGIQAMEASQVASRRRLDDLFQSLLHRAFRGEL
jgi:type I restriction enzyme, S subunit